MDEDESEEISPDAAILPASVTSFRDYFKRGTEAGVLLRQFGYDFETQEQVLPRAAIPSWHAGLSARLSTFR